MFRTVRRYRSGPLAGRLETVRTDRREAVGFLARHTATTPAYVVVRCERVS